MLSKKKSKPKLAFGLVFEDELVVLDVDDDGFVLVDFLGKDVL